MRRDYRGESLFGRSARGAVDQIGYALSLFALISAKSESIFLLALQRIQSGGPGGPLLWPGPEPLHGRLWTTEKNKNWTPRGLPVLGGGKCFSSLGFWRTLARCGILKNAPRWLRLAES